MLNYWQVFNVISKEENDLLIHAGTGKGKTLSYLLPLANQMYEGDVGLTVALIQPNSLLKAQIRGVVERLAPDFMNNFKICTPRQLRDQEVNACVIDEADLTLSAACLPPKMKINDFLRGEIGAKKRIIYSGATFPVENSFRSIRAQILKYNKNTVMIEDESIVSERVAIHAGNEKFIRFDKEEERLERLRKIITSSEELKGKVMIFVRNKTEVAGLKKAIKDLLTKNEVIVTTDSMSRGIDIDSLQHVVHYYPPMSAVDYVHRVGRVNRLNSKLDRHECKSHCLISNEDLEDGPVYLKLLLNSRDSIETVKSADITKFFSRNRSINKQIRRGKLQI